MSKDELFELYKRVQKRDRNAEMQLILEHKKHFPNNIFHKTGIKPGYSDRYREDLHTLYLHLTSKIKK